MSKHHPLIDLEIDFSQLSQAQIRLLKSTNALVAHILTTDNEAEFFESSADLMKVMASVIKQANFPKLAKTHSKIAYADQALEYSFDNLADMLNEDHWEKRDN